LAPGFGRKRANNQSDANDATIAIATDALKIAGS
jgi:hypothetical protein